MARKKQINTKSFVFIILVVATAAVAVFLIRAEMKEFEAIGNAGASQQKTVLIESADVFSFDAELERDLKSLDQDSSGLLLMQDDASLQGLVNDLKNLNF